MINKVTLVGNLGRDPEVRHLESGSMVARFPIATNENYRDKNGEWQTITEWHNIVVWRHLAERAERTLKKGMLVYVEGKITTRKWQDQNGQDRYSTDIVANILRSLERREGGDSGFGSDFPSEKDEIRSFSSGSSTSQSGESKASTPNTGAQDFSDVEDDLPF